eukprot:gene2612-4443_t
MPLLRTVAALLVLVAPWELRLGETPLGGDVPVSARWCISLKQQLDEGHSLTAAARAA